MNHKNRSLYLLLKRALLFTTFWFSMAPVTLAGMEMPQSGSQTIEKPYAVGVGGVEPPVVVYQPLPPYTEEARAFRIEGIVVVQAVIRKDGTVGSFKILRGLGYGLDESAIKTIGSNWRFQPGTLNGNPVDVQANIEVAFRLFQKPQDRGKLNEYPLRAQIINSEWKEGRSGEKTGSGSGNLWSGISSRAFTYAHSCEPLLRKTGDFPAKWKEPESSLEVVMLFEPRTQELKVCEFQVTMQDGKSQNLEPAPIKTESRPAVSSQAAEPIPAPDLRFYEVQVNYPLFRHSFRLVPRQGLPQSPASRTSVFRLVEDPSVPRGTSMGPQERSGAPAPISTFSCRDPLMADLRVWVRNEGTSDFWAESQEQGLTGYVDGIDIAEFINTVEAGKIANFQTRSFELGPGIHRYKLVLNAAMGQGERNIQNNSFEGQFEITCTNPAEPSSSSSEGSSISAKLYDIETGASIQSFSGGGRGSAFAAFSPDGSTILTGWPGVPTLWDIRSGQKIASFKNRHRCSPGTAPYSSMFMVSFSPDGTKAITANTDSSATVWDLKTQAELKTYCSDNLSGITFVGFVSDGSEALIGRFAGPAVWLKVETGKIARTLNLKGSILAVSPDGTRIVSAGGVQETSGLGMTCSFPSLTRAAFSRDGNTIFGASWDSLNSWDANSCVLKDVVRKEQESLYDISPDARLALTGRWDDKLNLWDLQSHKLLRTFAGPVRGAAFSPDSKRVLALGYGERQRF